MAYQEEKPVADKKVLLAFRCTQSEVEMYKNLATMQFSGNVSALIREAVIQYVTKELNRAGQGIKRRRKP